MTDDLTIKIGANADNVKEVSQTIEDLLDRWAMNIDSFDGAEANLDISGFEASTKTASEAIEELLAKVETLRGLEFVDSDSAQLDQTVEALNELKGRADELSKIEITFLDSLGKNLDGLVSLNKQLSQASKSAEEWKKIEAAFAKADQAATPVKKTVQELNAEIANTKAEGDEWARSFNESERGAAGVRDLLSDIFELKEDTKNELNDVVDKTKEWSDSFNNTKKISEETKNELVAIQSVIASAVPLMQDLAETISDNAFIDYNRIANAQLEAGLKIRRERRLEATKENLSDAQRLKDVDAEVQILRQMAKEWKVIVSERKEAADLAAQEAKDAGIRLQVQGRQDGPFRDVEAVASRANSELAAANENLGLVEKRLEDIKQDSDQALKEFNKDLERQKIILSGDREAVIRLDLSDRGIQEENQDAAVNAQLEFEAVKKIVEERKKEKEETEKAVKVFQEQKKEIEARNAELKKALDLEPAAPNEAALGAVQKAREAAAVAAAEKREDDAEAIQRAKDIAEFGEGEVANRLEGLRKQARAARENEEAEKRAEKERLEAIEEREKRQQELIQKQADQVKEAQQREKDLAKLKDKTKVDELAAAREVGRQLEEQLKKRRDGNRAAAEEQKASAKNVADIARDNFRDAEKRARDLERLERKRTDDQERVENLEERQNELVRQRNRNLGGFDSGIEALTSRIATAASSTEVDSSQKAIEKNTTDLVKAKDALENTNKLIAEVKKINVRAGMGL